MELLKTENEALESLGITRHCCKRMIISQKDYIKEIMQYQK